MSEVILPINTTYGFEDNFTAIDPLLSKIMDDAVYSHPALQELSLFGQNLQTRALTTDELRCFFASLVAFVGDIPGGIIALSLRLTDDWFEIDPLNATAMGAGILFAAVDEYGLHDMKRGVQGTHHQLFLDTVGHWGLTAQDILDPAYILEEGRAFGRTTYNSYRRKSIAHALGFHFASEATSSIEFEHYLSGLLRFSDDYRLSGIDDPALRFFVIHTEVEPMHREMGFRMIQQYRKRQPDLIPEVVAGIRAFMDAYGAMFGALNLRLFGRNTTSFAH